MVLSPAQTQPPPVTDTIQYTEEEFAKNNIERLYKVDLPPDDVEKVTLRDDKFMAKWLKINQKHIDKAIASWKKPNCEITIDRPVATDMVPAEEPEKIEGKKKNQRVGRKGKGKMSC